MKTLCALIIGLFTSQFLLAQTKPATTPPTVVSVIEGVSGKQFVPDTTYSALSADDVAALGKAPLANWDLPRENGKYVLYSNLVVGTRSYQLVMTKVPKEEFPTAQLIRYETPTSKPEPIARGVLKPKGADKPK
ncbi:hypothetical protein [Fibrella arboris]|uniref:hypothetical protein n=1 Tax=Fibrella arboris TaxID=3242486 RepID=UPI003520448B